MVCTHRARMERSNLANIAEKAMSFKESRKETRGDFIAEQETLVGQPNVVMFDLGKLFIHQLPNRRSMTGCESHAKLILKLLQIQSIAPQTKEYAFTHQLSSSHKFLCNKGEFTLKESVAVV